MSMNADTDELSPAEIEAIVADLEEQIQAGPSEADIEAELEVEAAAVWRVRFA